MEKKTNITELDGLESLQVRNQKSDFPEHYHDTFCISLIQSGMEAIKMHGNIIYTETGHISINNPLEIHANPLIKESPDNSFTTLYLSPDLVNSILNKKRVVFEHQQVVNKDCEAMFLKILKNIELDNISDLEKNLNILLKGFNQQADSKQHDKTYTNRKWDELITYIDNHLEQKISLDFLAKFMNMNKFNFAKEFRMIHGLSPINYVLMKKVFRAKSLITPASSLTHIAYQFDFTDQAHFSKHFKRFVGVSPREYQRQI
ncbi:MAG: AraC family transcriptional regulator [Bacteroidia bacterium]|nr:AraC family transcriptional regulator [Bacteroidia bacterium]